VRAHRGLCGNRIATHRLALSDVPSGFARLRDPQQGVIKAIVEC
jgi:hypothetical protein